MRSLLTHNWRAKLVSLLIAFVIWLVIRNSIDHQQRSPIEHYQMKVESKF